MACYRRHQLDREAGTINGVYANGSFAVFAGTAGTVTVDNGNGAVQASGMQFASDGYRIQGDEIALAGTQATMRVGDGSSVGAGYTATVASNLSGTSELVKTDLGKLVLEGTNTYTGGTRIDGGTISIAADANLGDASGGLTLNNGTLQTTGDLSSARAVTLAGNGTMLTDAGTTATLSGGVAGLGALTKDGAGTLALAGDATHTGGTTVTAGTLQVGAGGTTGSLAGNVTNNGTLAFNRTDTVTFDGTVSGTGALRQAGSGITILTADHSYSGGTTIEAGTLQLGNGGASGMIAGDVTTNGRLAFNRADTVTFGGTITGTGGLSQDGTGTTILTAANGYGGTTTVNNGTLLIQGDQSGATGATTVNAGTLGGTGIIGGDVTVVDGASVAPGGTTNVPGTLAIRGDLTLASAANMKYDFGQAGVVGGAYNDLIEVGGDLTLGGTLNVSESAGGNFGPGLYRVISYGGTLTDNPVAVSSPDYFLQTSIDKQVNLVNTAGLTLNYWDGDAGGRNDGQIAGGNGTWQAGLSQDNWTTDSGSANAPFQDQSFAVFAGNAGTVTVDDSQGNVNVAGMQFAADGYRIEGDAIGLSGTQATIRVGDGTADGAGYTATIASNLSGGSELVKTDLGKLVLEGANTYAGGTRIDGGTVSIAADANLGDASGGLTLNGGTLQTTADLSSTRTVTLAGNGTILTDAGTTATFGGTVAGPGALTKDGAGTLALSGDATHNGGTTIAAGTLQIGAGGTTGSLAGNVTNNGTLAFDRSDAYTFDGTISGTGALRQAGSGTTILTADHSYSGGTTIEAGTLQLGNGGTSGTIAGNVTNHGTLAFNRADTVTFGGTVSGTGGIRQDGAGTTILTAANNYGGTTTVNNGTLLIQGDQSAATGATAVNAGMLGGTGIIGGDVTVAGGATLSPGAAAGNPDTLTINGDLALQAGAMLDYDFGRANTVGGPLNDLVEVVGDLSLGGTLNVKTAAGGAFGPGVYRVISYGGNLLGGTLGLGSLPTGSRATVQTAIDKQVNLVNASNNALNFWDGDAGGRGDGRITGGDGVWRAAGDDNWTEADGGTNAAFGNGGFAVFAGTAGKVTVDNSQGQVEASGMQFATNGYTVEGDRLVLTGSDATIRVGDGTAGGANYVATINAALSGTSGLTKTDAGTLVLGGTSDYSGATTVAGGTLTVNGAIASSPVSVQQGATLAGTGTVGATTVAGGATIAPAGNGSGSGTLNVNGNYVQQADGVYQAHVDPTSSASDRIAVSGSATLAEGARLNVTKTSNAAYVAGTRYTVLTAAGGLNGAFTLAGDTAVTAFMGLRGDYDANNAYLVVQQARAIDNAGQTPNQIAAGRGVDSLAGNDPLKIAVLNLTDDAAARNALDQLSGEIRASIRTASIEESRFVRDAATDRLRDAFCAVGSEQDKRDARGTAHCGPESSRPSGWVRVFGAWGSHDGNGNAGAMHSSTGGILLGADSAVSQNWRVGVLAGYSHTNVDVDSRHSSGSIDNYHAGIYGGGQWGALGLRTGAAYTWQDIGTSRSVNFAGFRDHARADYRAGMAQVFGDLGYRIDAGRYSYEPFVNVAHVNLDTRGFDEQGGAAALASPGNTSDVTFSTLGLRTTADISLGRLTGTLRGSLGWRHAFGDRTPMSTLALRGGDQFGVAGVPIADDAAVVNAGLDIKVGKATTMGLSYSGQFAGNSRAQTVKASLKVLF
ncbi:autotransporter-associated beta strand repeat-containing protein [Cupriavidus gilardii]|uniref:autotransporter-associated beta strand repeat-containing protein n=1 Tax=Cupriavidus gilardii TaxID=82541 RepID=UPI001572DD0B|nr:autotransporter domain-containing protein [Cupriavidus gilardii]NSX04284.1 autotransporter domain-containing protein [Cupriavidus gilardii]